MVDRIQTIADRNRLKAVTVTRCVDGPERRGDFYGLVALGRTSLEASGGGAFDAVVVTGHAVERPARLAVNQAHLYLGEIGAVRERNDRGYASNAVLRQDLIDRCPSGCLIGCVSNEVVSPSTRG